VQDLSGSVHLLVCPETKQPLAFRTKEAAVATMDPPGLLRPQNLAPLRTKHRPVGVTPTVLLREDQRCAYPVVDGIPVLLAPEMLTTSPPRAFDLRDPRWAESYEEVDFYDEVATREASDIEVSPQCERARRIVDAGGGAKSRASYPDPVGVWLDATHECTAQREAYASLAPLAGKRILQLGGKGTHAVKFLLAGAAEAWTISPMIGEARCAMALARAIGVADHLRCVTGIGEELPFADAVFDAVYSGGCVHHMTTENALPEVARILRPGGVFAAVEPWRAPLYAIGTKVLGKRESVHCRPLTNERVAPLRSSFAKARVVQHGTFTRYPA
jgi:uncharacterized protein YbaR (Trm112 family)/SAM-dependent methyltransferase